MPLPIQKLRDGTGSKALATSLTPATAGFSNPNSVGPTQLPFKRIPPGGSSTRTQAGFGSNPSLQTAHSQQERWPTDGFTSMENLFRKQKRFTVILRKNGILGRDNNGKTPIQAAGAQCPPPCVIRKRKKVCSAYRNFPTRHQTKKQPSRTAKPCERQRGRRPDPNRILSRDLFRLGRLRFPPAIA